MARHESVEDFTDSKKFDVSITVTGNVVSIVTETEHCKSEQVMDEDAFATYMAVLIAEGKPILNKRKGAA